MAMTFALPFKKSCGYPQADTTGFLLLTWSRLYTELAWHGILYQHHVVIYYLCVCVFARAYPIVEEVMLRCVKPSNS